MLFSCNNESRRLTITDLDLTGVISIDKEIANNRVKKVYYVAGNLYKKVQPDTFARIEYDATGRETLSFTDPPYGGSFEIAYDTFGLVKKINYADSDEHYEASYSFDPVSNILKQFWSGTVTDTCLFYFDRHGKLTRSFAFDYKRPCPFKYRTDFFYNKQGYLSKTMATGMPTDTRAAADNGHDSSSAIVAIDYSYTGEALDSTTEVHKYPDGKGFTRKNLFDKNGLPTLSYNTDDGHCFIFKYEKW